MVGAAALATRQEGARLNRSFPSRIADLEMQKIIADDQELATSIPASTEGISGVEQPPKLTQPLL